MSEERVYQFDVTLQGTATSPEEAWANACEAFSLDPGVHPDNYASDIAILD